jgi:oxygen-independent coproporphyrinogen-3 oxidase
MFVEAGFIVDEDRISDPIQMSLYVPQELQHEWENKGGIRPTEAGLERIDYILPRLLKLSPHD